MKCEVCVSCRIDYSSFLVGFRPAGPRRWSVSSVGYSYYGRDPVSTKLSERNTQLTFPVSEYPIYKTEGE